MYSSVVWCPLTPGVTDTETFSCASEVIFLPHVCSCVCVWVGGWMHVCMLHACMCIYIYTCIYACTINLKHWCIMTSNNKKNIGNDLFN